MSEDLKDTVRVFTKRDVEVARQAANEAAEEVFRIARALGGIEHVDMRRWAEERYQVPKVERPRTVEIGRSSYRVIQRNGTGGPVTVTYQAESRRWIECPHIYVSNEYEAKLAASLFASPNELVDADADGAE